MNKYKKIDYKQNKYVYDGNIKEKTLWNWCIKNNRTEILDSFYLCNMNDVEVPKKKGPLNNEKAFWYCKECNGIYETQIYVKTKGYNCPYCTNRKVLTGFNDLKTKMPELAKEYSDENTIPVDEIYYKSGKRILWKCSKCGEKWETSAKQRVESRTGCPKCWNSRQISFPELAILYYCRTVFTNVEYRNKQFGIELDVYIPEIKTAIEYDGGRWHKGNKIESDNVKDKKCKEEGIRLIRVRAEGLGKTKSAETIYVKQNDKGIKKGLEELGTMLNVEFDIDINRDIGKIFDLKKNEELQNSILVLGENIEKQWDYEKNYPLKPENFAAQSDTKVWWKCEKGHSYKQKIVKKYIGQNCPICAGKEIKKGENDFESNYPNHLQMWDYGKNDVLPSQITKKSSKEVWWKCKICEAEIYMSPKAKVSKEHMCVNCYKIEQGKGIEDLKTSKKYLNMAEAEKEMKISYKTIKRKIKKGEFRVLSFEEKIELYKKRHLK